MLNLILKGSKFLRITKLSENTHTPKKEESTFREEGLLRSQEGTQLTKHAEGKVPQRPLEDTIHKAKVPA